MFCVGLTGGIASGKTTVSDSFLNLGIAIVDTDVIAREIVAPGTPCLEKIRAHFGEGIVDKHQALDRKQLREIIFSQPEEKAWLENLMHPVIREETRRQIQSAAGPYVILSSPLLIESPDIDLVDRVLVVDVPTKVQIQRTQARDNVSEAQIKKTIEAQLSREQRLARADDIIDNSGSQAETQQAVERLHQTYLTLSQTP